ncbi:hypothetical protein Dsin_009306 [Dipteronia sinensis]|uniref:Reverse transcriptase zinc-binding domain-containing protein n=1 Tax=Dipteronia sinensis TaxID=43782 RepID=A0AAE0AQB2_9ROSI|nr:hypothetical protein Dsin_009306 [Dipteronia sinensis]
MICVWNVRGAVKKLFSRNIMDLRRMYQFEVLAIFEPRISGSKAMSVINKRGFTRNFVVDAEGFSGEIWLLWNEDKVKLHVVASSRNNVTALIDDNSTLWVLTVVYANPCTTMRRLLWNYPDSIRNCFSLPWLVAGDFNEITNSSEKRGGRTGHSISGFAYWIDMNEIHEIQSYLSKRPSQYLSALEETLVKEYHDILQQEEIFWQKKSRHCWLKERDRNTKFFHISTIIRRKRNKIEGFKKEDGSWIEDIGELKSKAVSYFLKLLKRSIILVAFVPGRQIQDNIDIAQEVLHKFKNMKGKISNTSNCNVRALADLCGSHVTKNLGSYLGVPLIHGCIMKDTYKEILVKTQKRLATWYSASISLAEKAHDYLVANEWDVGKLSVVLPWHIVLRIFRIHVTSNHGVDDTAVWSLSKNGDFTVNSVYEGHFKHADIISWKWSFIWKLKLPPRVIYFLWLLLYSKLLTNSLRATKGIHSDVTCMRCKLNVDGSMIPESCAISAEGVVRDHRKKWMVGFVLNKGT